MNDDVSLFETINPPSTKISWYVKPLSILETTSVLPIAPTSRNREIAIWWTPNNASNCLKNLVKQN